MIGMGLMLKLGTAPREHGSKPRVAVQGADLSRKLTMDHQLLMANPLVL